MSFEYTIINKAKALNITHEQLVVDTVRQAKSVNGAAKTLEVNPLTISRWLKKAGYVAEFEFKLRRVNPNSAIR